MQAAVSVHCCYRTCLTMHCHWGWLSSFFCLWWPWPLSSDLDIQTCPSEVPNTSSLWIWRKSFSRSRDVWFTNKMNEKKRAKDVLPNIDRTQTPEITPSSDANTQWCHPLPLHAVCRERIPFVCCRGGDGRAKCSFCTWWHWRLTLTFKLIQVRDQTRPPSEFAANAFSGSQGISCTNKKHNEEVTDSPKNRTLLACSNDHVKRLRKIYY